MEDSRLPKQLLNYHPKGRRRPGRPLKRLLDDMAAETETDHAGLNSWWNMMMMILVLAPLVIHTCLGDNQFYSKHWNTHAYQLIHKHLTHLYFILGGCVYGTVYRPFPPNESKPRGTQSVLSRRLWISWYARIFKCLERHIIAFTCAKSPMRLTLKSDKWKDKLWDFSFMLHIFHYCSLLASFIINSRSL
jgi:hypothetical protein